MNTRISDAAVEAWASRHGLSSRTLRQAYEEATLPHMQQAEGGDTRGLAEHITDHLCHHEYDIGGRNELLACITEAIAARRSSGGQGNAAKQKDRFEIVRNGETEDVRIAALADWLDQCDYRSDVMTVAAATLRALAARQTVGQPVIYQIREELVVKDDGWFNNPSVKQRLNAWREIPKSHYDAYLSVMGGVGPVGVVGHPDGPVALELNRHAPKTEIRALYVAPPVQAMDPEGVADVLRELLGERNHRTDGDLVTLAKRCRHLSRGDRDLIAMRGTLIEKLMQRTDSAQAVDLGQLRALADRWATDRSYSGSPSDDLRALIDGSKAVQS